MSRMLVSAMSAAAVAAAAVSSALAAEPAAKATVTVDLAKELRPMKPMNAVNNGPAVANVGGDQKRGNFADYKAARIPYARLHDAINCVNGGAHAVDVNAIFRDFDADETDPRNYDFVFTDHYLDTIQRAGTKIYYRLGQTIEHGPKKYGVLPPKDFAKWARICEGIVRHYNEGWGWALDKAPTTKNIAWSNQFNVVYWEIWNEPDLDIGQWETNPRCWGASPEEFYRLYETAAKHLKSKFPNLKIGGPALAGNEEWAERFIAHCEKTKAPLDFFSWHTYLNEPDTEIVQKARRVRAMLDRHGFKSTESINNEWNYVKGWGDDWVYSLRVESGDLCLKGAALIAATMSACQSEPIDMLMFYDARTHTVMNSLFDLVTYWPKKGYYPFLAWADLVEGRPTQVACSVVEGTGVASDANTGFLAHKDKAAPAAPGGFRAVAAKGARGGAALLSRYSDDDNVSDVGEVTIRVPGVSLAGARCYLTDLVRTYTKTPMDVQPDGSAKIRMQPLSFALVEWGE